MAHTVFNEYRDQFQNTNYPFADSANLTSQQGLTLPQTLFLDAGFCFGSGMPYLSRFTVSADEVVLTVRSDSMEAHARMSVSNIPDNLSFFIDSGQNIGILVSEKVRLGWFATLDPGTYTFFPENTAFAVRCNTPTRTLGVSSLQVDNTGLYGDVWLVGSDGVFLTKSKNGVRIDVLGEVLYKQKEFPGLETPNCLKTINGLPADRYGNLNFGLRLDNSKTRLQITTTDNGIEVKRI